MPPVDKDFYARFPAFTGLAAEFSDPVDDSMPDEEIARDICKDIDTRRRAAALTRLLADSDRLLMQISNEWHQLSKYVNRGFVDESASAEWLQRMRMIWADELVRIEGGKR